jgi:hypothetical protein
VEGLLNFINVYKEQEHALTYSCSHPIKTDLLQNTPELWQRKPEEADGNLY